MEALCCFRLLGKEEEEATPEEEEEEDWRQLLALSMTESGTKRILLVSSEPGESAVEAATTRRISPSIVPLPPFLIVQKLDKAHKSTWKLMIADGCLSAGC